MAEDTYLQTLEKVSVTIEGETFDIVAASFRGVPFFVDSYNHGGLGRTIATKKIPFSDRFVHEDIGGNVPTQTLNIFLVGDDCDIQRQNLIEACGKEGAAEFVHPWLGKFNARVSQLSFSANQRELGYIKGSITIEQEDDIPNKSVSSSMQLKTKVDSESFRSKSRAKFTDRFETLKKVKATLDSAVKETEKALDTISDARKSLNEVNEFVNEVGKIKSNIEVILQTPSDFAARIQNLLTTSASIFGYDVDMKEETKEFLSILSLEGDGEVTGLVRKTAASCLVSSLVDAKFSSVDEASEFQNRVSEAFDELLNNTDDVEDFMLFSSLQASALSYLRDTMANMAVVIEKEVKSTTNILTFCFDTYNGIDRIEEIMNRNGFSQGLFITPCKVKVLSK